MNVWMVLFAVVVFVVVIPVVLALTVWRRLGPRNRFFTFVDTGRAKIAVRGGKVTKVLGEIGTKTFDTQGNLIPQSSIFRLARRIFGGLYWVGFWPLDEVYIYRFQWTNLSVDGSLNPHPGPDGKGEWLDFVLINQDVYHFEVKGAEDVDLLPLHLELLLTLKVVNPQKALFMVQNWLETVINRFKPMVVDHVVQSKYENLVQQKGSMGGALFSSSALLQAEFLDQYGVEVIAVEVKEIDPPDEYREATLSQWQAEQDEKRINVEARAEAARIRRVYGQLQRLGDFGKIARILEALEKTPAGVLTVHAVPGLTEVLGGVFGTSASVDLQTELRELREQIEKLAQVTNGSGNATGGAGGGAGAQTRRAQARREEGGN